MNERLECLKLALEYSKEYNKQQSSKYMTENGIILVAKKFYAFVLEDNKIDI